MGFEIGRAVNGGAEWACRSSFGNRILRNPVVTALLITALCLVVIYAIYRAEIRAAGWRPGLRAGVYLAVLVSLVLFVHYYALRKSVEDEHAQKGVREVVHAVHHNYAGGGVHSVDPAAIGAYTGGEEEYPAGPGQRAPARLVAKQLGGTGQYTESRAAAPAEFGGADRYSESRPAATGGRPDNLTSQEDLDFADAVIPSEYY